MLCDAFEHSALLSIFMLSPPVSVGEVIMFSGCLSVRRVCFLFIRLFVLTDLLPRYLMNGFRNLDEICREYSVASTYNLVRFWGSKVKVIAGRRIGEGIHVDGSAPKFNLLVSFVCSHIC